MLDAASGPIQYEEYLAYSKAFDKRYCVDISNEALRKAREKIGAHGEFCNCSILNLPFSDDYFDCTLSIHTIYHIDAGLQEKAVWELLRVTRPGMPVIILYANPRSLFRIIRKPFGFLKRLLRKIDDNRALYYHPHPLGWWKRFESQCQLKIYPWRFLAATDSKIIAPNNMFGKSVFKLASYVEKNFPNIAVCLGDYPMLVLVKPLPISNHSSTEGC